MSKSKARPSIALKRVYEPAKPDDGTRVLVERLWPRGVTRERAAIDLWLKEIAPSPELRKWYGHDPARWDEFRRRYRAELEANTEAIHQLRTLARRGPLTLVFATKDADRSSAILLKQYLEETADDGGGA